MHILRPFFALSLFLLINVATLTPALHELLHYHQHFHCTATASEVHLHAAQYDCRLCDYITKVTYYNDPVSLQINITEPQPAKVKTQEYTYYQPQLGLQLLRGPPAVFA